MVNDSVSHDGEMLIATWWAMIRWWFSWWLSNHVDGSAICVSNNEGLVMMVDYNKKHQTRAKIGVVIDGDLTDRYGCRWLVTSFTMVWDCWFWSIHIMRDYHTMVHEKMLSSGQLMWLWWINNPCGWYWLQWVVNWLLIHNGYVGYNGLTAN